MNVLFVGARLCRNLGGPSLLVATKALLRSHFPGAQFTLLTPQEAAQEDKALEPIYGVSCLPFVSRKALLASALLRFLGVRTGSPATQAVLDEYHRADVVIDLWGIAFADSLGSNSFSSRLGSGLHLLLGRLAGKKVVKYTADYGPLETRWNRFFARLYLNHCVDLILARDESSEEHLLSLPVRTPVHVCPDTAFLLEPEDCPDSARLARVREQQPVVGLSVSYQAMNRHGRDPSGYLSLTAGFADAVIAGLGSHVVIIPNEISDGDNDDGRVAEAVYQRLARSSDATLVGRGWSAQQLKGTIRQCDVMVAARYHTLVAALSMGIPSLAIGWHHKYHGLLSLVGQDRYVCDVEGLDLEHLLARFHDLWSSRESQTLVIRAKLPGIRAQIAAGGDLVNELLKGTEGNRLRGTAK